MRINFLIPVCLGICASAAVSRAQSPAAASAPTDVYHVMFVKAAPGQAATLAKQLQEPDPKDPMSAHFLLLRHQEGADWDYCLIQHSGTKASVEIPASAPNTPPTIAWHDDTFVSGPSWAEFQKKMGLGGDAAGSPVYVVGVHRAVPGHRQQLLEALNAPSTVKPAPANLTFTHVEGGQWQYLTVTRYGSWQELGGDRQPGGEGWSQIRQHSAFHNDTVADRVR